MANRTTSKLAWVVALSLSGGCATEMQEEPGAMPSSGAGGAGSGATAGAAGALGGGGSANKGGTGGIVGQSGSSAEEAGTSGSGPEAGSGGGGAGGSAAGNAGGGAGGKGGGGGSAGMGGKASGGAGGGAGMAGTGGLVQPNPCATGKLAITGGAASTIELPEFAAAMAWDGDGVTRWASAKSEPHWIYVDLGEVAHVSRVRLTWEAAYATVYRIERSNSSNGPWTVMQSINNGNGDTDDLTMLTAGDGRYIRMYGVTRSTAYGFSLFEMEVFGDLDESCQ